MKENDDCERILDYTRDEKLAGEGFSKEIVTSGSESSAFGAVPYKEDVVAVLWRQMATSSSQDAFFSPQDLLEGTGRSFSRLYGQKTQRNVRERVMALRSSEV